MHTGYFRPTASPPPPAIQELCAIIRVLPPQDSKPLPSRFLYDSVISKHIHIMIMQSNNSCNVTNLETAIHLNLCVSTSYFRMKFVLFLKVLMLEVCENNDIT